jgi:hypothetical protein
MAECNSLFLLVDLLVFLIFAQSSLEQQQAAAPLATYFLKVSGKMLEMCRPTGRNRSNFKRETCIDFLSSK